MTEWLYVIAVLSGEPKSAQPMTEQQCKAIAVKMETKKGRRVAACLSPAGEWFPSPPGPIAPKKTQVASR